MKIVRQTSALRAGPAAPPSPPRSFALARALPGVGLLLALVAAFGLGAWGQAQGWFAPLLVAFFTLAWCLMIYALIGDRPVTWQYGAAPYIPARSVLSSERKPAGTAPNQVTLPEEKEERNDRR